MYFWNLSCSHKSWNLTIYTKTIFYSLTQIFHVKTFAVFIKPWKPKNIHVDSMVSRHMVVCQQKVVWHISVLFTGTTKLPFSILCISRTTGLICAKFTYIFYVLYMYIQLYMLNLKKIRSVVCEIFVPEIARFSSRFL